MYEPSWIHIFLCSSNIWSFTYSFKFFIFYGYITNSQCNQLPDALIAQSVEHCTGIAEVMASNPVQAWMFFSFFFRLSQLLKFCEKQRWSIINSYVNVCYKKLSVYESFELANKRNFDQNICDHPDEFSCEKNFNWLIFSPGWVEVIWSTPRNILQVLANHWYSCRFVYLLTLILNLSQVLADHFYSSEAGNVVILLLDLKV